MNSELTKRALEKVGKGISPKEVESILGQPSQTETTKLPLETQKSKRYFVKPKRYLMFLHQ
jgi:hypothetical protein